MRADMVPGIPTILSFNGQENGLIGIHQYILDPKVHPYDWPTEEALYFFKGFMPMGEAPDE